MHSPIKTGLACAGGNTLGLPSPQGSLFSSYKKQRADKKFPGK
jgi:hypothetical protein